MWLRWMRREGPFTRVHVHCRPATPPAHHCPDLLGAAHAPHVGASVARGDGGLALEVLSVHPPVWRVADFLSPAESEWYVGRAKQRMGADLVGGGMGASGVISGDGEAAAGTPSPDG